MTSTLGGGLSLALGTLLVLPALIHGLPRCKTRRVGGLRFVWVGPYVFMFCRKRAS